MDIRERMKNGKLYFCTDESVAREQLQCLDKLYDFNQTRPSEMEKRQKLLKELLAEVGENCYVEPPLHANWAKNTHFGSNVYANFNLTLVDDTDIYVGDSVIGAGSIVTKDIPAGVVAVGNPCRVLRPINDRDREYYFRELKIDLR